MVKFLAFTLLLIFLIIIYQVITFFDPFIKAMFVYGMILIGFAVSILSVVFAIITIMRIKEELMGGKFKEAIYALLLGLFLTSWMAALAYKIFEN